MKLILAIISNEDSPQVQAELAKNGFITTKLATSGGFLMSGNTTIICGTEDEKVEKFMAILEEHSKTRTQIVPSSAAYGAGLYSAFPVEVAVGGATVFVMNVDQFYKI